MSWRSAIRGTAPTGQIDGILAHREGQAHLNGLFEILFDHLFREFPTQEIGPEELAERRRVLRKAADTAQFACEAAKRIVRQIRDRFRQILEMPSLALGIVRID